MSSKPQSGAVRDGSAFSNRRKRGKSIFWIFFWTLFFFLLFFALTFLYYVKTQAKLDAHLFSLYLRNQEKTTVLVSKEALEQGERTAEPTYLYNQEHRLCVSYDRMPRSLSDAAVAIEDQRFYSHHGVDWKRTIGATGKYLLGKASYGGSTITQQLIKNVTEESESSPRRKVKEIARASQLERHFSKEEILCMYLNTIYFGNHCYGVQSAANFFFDVDVSELDLAQCASLIAIVQSPQKWSPITHPQAHIERRNLVLSAMYAQGKIGETEYEQARGAPLSVSAVEAQSNAPIDSWYTEAVIQEGSAFLAQHYHIDFKVAQRLLQSGGFTIVTAMDPTVQSVLEHAWQENATFGVTEDSLITPQSACVVLHPKTGAVLGIVGARGEKNDNRILNYATDTKRPPGSALKPLSVYAPAMQAGLLHYGTVYDDTPVNFTLHEQGWPQNYPKEYRGLTPVHDAVARSVNTVAVKALWQYGIENSFSFLKDRLHFSSLVSEKKGKDGVVYTDRATAPLALGQLTYGVSVLELTAGYTIFTDDGRYHAPFCIWELRDSEGNLLYQRDTTGESVLSQANAQVMTQMLKEVTTNGTAKSLTLKDKMDTAGKTGTTTDDCDRWFVGYTQDYLCGVWFGYATPQPLDGYSERQSPAVCAWDTVMQTLETPVLEQGMPKPFDTSCLLRTAYCRDSGKLPAHACGIDPRGERIEFGYFTPQQLPTVACDCHISVPYDFVNGGVCIQGCHPLHCHLVGLITAPLRDFNRQIYITDAQYVYRPIGDLPPSPYQNAPFFENTLEKGHYVGISKGEVQFNRACYTDWSFWNFQREWEEKDQEIS